MLSVVLVVVFYLIYLSAIPGITVSGPSEDTDQNKEPPGPFWEVSEQINYCSRDTRRYDSVPPARLVSELDAKRARSLPRGEDGVE